MSYIAVEVERDGIMRRVLIPGPDANPTEGIPDDHWPLLLELYADATDSFRKKLYNELRVRGLLTIQDLVQPSAIALIRAALLATIKNDAFNLQKLAQEAL